MYIRRFRRQRSGKGHSYWGLVESYRTERGPRQRLVTYLGKEDEAGGLGVKVALDGSSGWWQPALEGFEGPRPRWVEVDWSRIHLERSKEFGGAWLGLEVARRLGLPELLDELVERGREDVPWSSMALVLVLARLLDPSSELRLAETIYDRTAMSARFEERIEEGMAAIARECERRRLTAAVVGEKVGRLPANNTRAARLFEYRVAPHDGNAARLDWRKPEQRHDWVDLSAGCYMLRTNVTDWTPEELWQAYIQLTQAEDAFRIHKTDL